mgnify:CR=1 FL=1
MAVAGHCEPGPPQKKTGSATMPSLSGTWISSPVVVGG